MSEPCVGPAAIDLARGTTWIKHGIEEWLRHPGLVAELATEGPNHHIDKIEQVIAIQPCIMFDATLAPARSTTGDRRRPEDAAAWQDPPDLVTP